MCQMATRPCLSICCIALERALVRTTWSRNVVEYEKDSAEKSSLAAI